MLVVHIQIILSSGCSYIDLDPQGGDDVCPSSERTLIMKTLQKLVDVMASYHATPNPTLRPPPCLLYRSRLILPKSENPALSHILSWNEAYNEYVCISLFMIDMKVNASGLPCKENWMYMATGDGCKSVCGLFEATLRNIPPNVGMSVTKPGQTIQLLMSIVPCRRGTLTRNQPFHLAWPFDPLSRLGRQA